MIVSSTFNPTESDRKFADFVLSGNVFTMLQASSFSAGEESLRMLKVALEAVEESKTPGELAQQTPEDRFHELLKGWLDERGSSSSVSQLSLHPKYQQIIGMGATAIPFILRELEREPKHLFWALHAITGENPVPEADRGRIRKMAEAWIRWGKDRGYRW